MNIVNTYLNDVLLLKSNCFTDFRGNFIKVFDSADNLLENFSIKQVNYVTSKEKFTLRGLHYQLNEHAEAKIFRVIKGKAQVAFVNILKSSNHYNSDFVLLDAPDYALFVPKGYATGYCTLADNTEVLYLSDNIYVPEAEAGVLWNDPLLKIDWETNNPVVSDKDRAWDYLKNQE